MRLQIRWQTSFCLYPRMLCCVTYSNSLGDLTSSVGVPDVPQVYVPEWSQDFPSYRIFSLGLWVTLLPILLLHLDGSTPVHSRLNPWSNSLFSLAISRVQDIFFWESFLKHCGHKHFSKRDMIHGIMLLTITYLKYFNGLPFFLRRIW
jgi:hypothetical protein